LPGALRHRRAVGRRLVAFMLRQNQRLKRMQSWNDQFFGWPQGKTSR
jgi:hypothetical protein